MAIVTNTGVIHLPFGERPQYGSPYPEGIAVAHADVTGDASGGAVTVAILADGGFLYRLELMNATRSDVANVTLDVISSHRWATDKSGLGATAFDLNWLATRQAVGTFVVYTLRGEDRDRIRRFPLGRTDKVALQTIWAVTFQTNVNTIEYDVDLVLTYWPKESLAMPGFLSSFYEAPAVPPLLRAPI